MTKKRSRRKSKRRSLKQQTQKDKLFTADNIAKGFVGLGTIGAIGALAKNVFAQGRPPVQKKEINDSPIQNHVEGTQFSSIIGNIEEPSSPKFSNEELMEYLDSLPLNIRIQEKENILDDLKNKKIKMINRDINKLSDNEYKQYMRKCPPDDVKTLETRCIQSGFPGIGLTCDIRTGKWFCTNEVGRRVLLAKFKEIIIAITFELQHKQELQKIETELLMQLVLKYSKMSEQELQKIENILLEKSINI